MYLAMAFSVCCRIRQAVGQISSDLMVLKNVSTIRSYETRIGELERSKLVMAEQQAQQATPKGRFEDQLEPVLTFLANPWKAGTFPCAARCSDWSSQDPSDTAVTRTPEPRYYLSVQGLNDTLNLER